MSIEKFLQLKEKLEIKKYVRSVDSDRENGISFYGSPRKHPHEKNRVVLVADPFSEHTFYYEFNIEDILLAEEQPSITNPDGESVSMIRIWVKKKSIAMRCAPFIVDTVKRP